MVNMETATAPRATFRKAKNGKWVVFGPTSIVKPGTVTVTKKNGSTSTVTVESVGKSFTANGAACCYGYLDARAPRHSDRFANNRPRRECKTHGNCSSFGNGRNCGGDDCDGY